MVNSAWAVQSSTALVQLIESKAQAAYVAACETTAEGTPPPEAPVHISDPVDAALKLLMDEDILAAAPRVVWMQQGIHDAAVAETLARAGIGVVQDTCAMIEHRNAQR
jgi:hypothetical protein